MQVEQWNFSHITAQIEGTKNKLKECPAIFYKKGVSKTVIGTSVLIIGAIAFYIFRTRILLMSVIYRKNILGPVILLVPSTVLMYSSIVSVCWIINGLYLLYKSRSIEKGENKQINYINETIKQLEIFLHKLDKKEKFIYENNNEQLKDYLNDLVKINRVTSRALKFKKELVISMPVFRIKEKLTVIWDSCTDLLKILDSDDNELKGDQIKLELNNVHEHVKSVSIQIEGYIEFISKSYQ